MHFVGCRGVIPWYLAMAAIPKWLFRYLVMGRNHDYRRREQKCLWLIWVPCGVCRLRGDAYFNIGLGRPNSFSIDAIDGPNIRALIQGPNYSVAITERQWFAIHIVVIGQQYVRAIDRLLATLLIGPLCQGLING